MLNEPYLPIPYRFDFANSRNMYIPHPPTLFIDEETKPTPPSSKKRILFSAGESTPSHRAPKRQKPSARILHLSFCFPIHIHAPLPCPESPPSVCAIDNSPNIIFTLNPFMDHPALFFLPNSQSSPVQSSAQVCAPAFSFIPQPPRSPLFSQKHTCFRTRVGPLALGRMSEMWGKNGRKGSC